jgi:rhamnosyltransferase
MARKDKRINPLVSIIIRTKNEEKWISSCLRGVFRQEYKNIEVIIVDNESKDRTVAKAQEFPIKLVEIKKFFPGKAINDGIRASSGDYIVCLSGHCIPVNDKWLSNLIKDLKNPSVAGVYSRQQPLSFTSDLDKRDLLTVFGKDRKIQIKDSFFHNASSAFTREIWKQFPFDEKLTNIEDRIWGELVISYGFNIIYEPDSSVYHWHGIHQDLNPDRARKIVKILEGINNLSESSHDQKPGDLNILAVIPTRGDIRLLNGKPLLEKTINSAKSSKFVTDIVVAADSEEAMLIAKEAGVNAPFMRPAELSERYIDVFDVVRYTVDWFEQQKQYYDVIVLLEEAYPFRSENMIDNMISKLVIEGCDTVIAGVAEMRSIWVENYNKVELLGSEKNITKPNALKESKNIIGMPGLCCVTYTTSLNNNMIFSGRVGIIETTSQLVSISARNNQELTIASIIDKYL